MRVEEALRVCVCGRGGVLTAFTSTLEETAAQYVAENLCHHHHHHHHHHQH